MKIKNFYHCKIVKKKLFYLYNMDTIFYFSQKPVNNENLVHGTICEVNLLLKDRTNKLTIEVKIDHNQQTIFWR